MVVESPRKFIFYYDAYSNLDRTLKWPVIIPTIVLILNTVLLFYCTKRQCPVLNYSFHYFHTKKSIQTHIT